MKRKIRLFLTAVCILAMVGGLFTAYAIDAHDSGTKGVPDDPEYFNLTDLSALYGGNHDYGYAWQKVRPNNSARFYISETLVNTTDCVFYVNVRNQDASAIVGNAHTVPVTATVTHDFNVVYLPGKGAIGSYYRSSMQTSSASTHGVVNIRGTWAP